MLKLQEKSTTKVTNDDTLLKFIQPIVRSVLDISGSSLVSVTLRSREYTATLKQVQLNRLQ